MCRTDFEGSQLHESPSRVELGFHNQISGGHLQAHRAPHPQLCLVPQMCPIPIWTNLRWSRIRLWRSRPVAIKRSWHPTSKQRLGSFPWGRTQNCALSSSMLAPSNPCTPVISLSPPTPPPPPTPTGLPSRPRTIASLEASEKEVTTRMSLLLSLVACWKRTRWLRR